MHLEKYLPRKSNSYGYDSAHLPYQVQFLPGNGAKNPLRPTSPPRYENEDKPAVRGAERRWDVYREGLSPSLSLSQQRPLLLASRSPALQPCTDSTYASPNK